MISRAKVVSLLLTTAVIGGAGIVLTAGSAAADEAIVTRVIDGDTVDVQLDGRTERVRLLNIDTPETKHPDQSVQCLGPEASAHLTALLPPGAAVTLQYDDERTDRYGRTLAAVFMADGTLVNAEMTRAGFATSVVFGENDRFMSAVQAGQDEAAASERGLYSTDVECTVPAQVEAVAEQAAAAQTMAAEAAAMSSTELESAVATVAAAAVAALALKEAFSGDRAAPVWAVVSASDLGRLQSSVITASRLAQEAEAELGEALDGALAREAEAARVAAQAEAERVAAEAEAARVAAEAEAARVAAAAAEAERARVAAADTARRVQAPAPSPSRAPSPTPEPPSSDPYPGYTGPRCYAPGGKTWKPC